MQIKSNKGGKLKSVLVVIQFSISIVLIIGTLIMFRQLNFMLNKDLGFDKEQIYVLRQAHVIGKKVKSFKEEIKIIPGVMNVSASTAVPGHNNSNNGYRIKGRPEDSYLMFTNRADYDYIKTYGIQLEMGRYFDPSYATDKEACIVNESTVKSFVLDDPLNIRFMDTNNETW